VVSNHATAFIAVNHDKSLAKSFCINSLRTASGVKQMSKDSFSLPTLPEALC